MASTDTFPLIDRLVPGGLAAFLTKARDAGESHEKIAFRLQVEHDVVTSAETVRKWVQRVSEPSGAAS